MAFVSPAGRHPEEGETEICEESIAMLHNKNRERYKAGFCLYILQKIIYLGVIKYSKIFNLCFPHFEKLPYNIAACNLFLWSVPVKNK